MTPEQVFRRGILRWFQLHPRSFPWRAKRDPYAVLVGEVLLQRTRGEHVVDVYDEFMVRWPHPSKLARARVRTIDSVIHPLGLAKRAAMLKSLGKALTALGSMPTEPADLQALPGVGPYAAHAVPVFATGRNLPVVDWVIARVLRRYFDLPSDHRPNSDPQLWSLAEHLAKRGKARELWLGTLDFAAAVCKPRPRCSVCPLTSGCAYFSRSSHTGLVAPPT